MGRDSSDHNSPSGLGLIEPNRVVHKLVESRSPGGHSDRPPTSKGKFWSLGTDGCRNPLPGC